MKEHIFLFLIKTFNFGCFIQIYLDYYYNDFGVNIKRIPLVAYHSPIKHTHNQATPLFTTHQINNKPKFSLTTSPLSPHHRRRKKTTTTMTSKDCGSHTHSRRKLFRRRIIWSIIFILFIICLTILLIWAILQPSKPRFILQDATVYAFNVSGNPPNLLTSNFQITLSSRNPNDKIGIYYDRLDVYATYHSQQITFRTSIPPTYQGHKEVNIWSPFVYGTSVPVAPFNAVSLDGDRDNGAVTLLIRADGRVRWKVGTFITGKYHLYVRCLAYINFGNKAAGVIVGDNAVKYTLTSSCSVSV